jgi:carboxypeptidase PM20D1
MAQTILVFIFVFLLWFLAFILLRTVFFPKKEQPVPKIKEIPIDTREAAIHLSNAIQHETISTQLSEIKTQDAFTALRLTLEKQYPKFHKHLQKDIIAEHSLFYTWEGTQPDLPPILMLAHQDVVPIDPDTLSEWTFAPFSGTIDDGHIWGRGTLDMKCQLISLFEAVEYLIYTGYQPQRTICFALGHDEEIGGRKGAFEIAKWLEEKNTRFMAIIDEGMPIANSFLENNPFPVALIATSEKGYATVNLSVECEPGHSSLPPKETAIGILGKAISRLEEHQMPARFSIAKQLFRSIGRRGSFGNQLVFANLWLFRRLVQRRLELNAKTNAMIRTTTAPTIIKGGVKDNILPHKVEAKINFRIFPGDTVGDVFNHIHKTIRDNRVTNDPEKAYYWEPSPVSPTDTLVYQTLEMTIKQVFGNIPVAPFLMMGATDARHFSGVSDNIFRLSPIVLDQEDMSRIHGIDERISIENLANMIRFFVQIIQNWDSLEIR